MRRAVQLAAFLLISVAPLASADTPTTQPTSAQAKAAHAKFEDAVAKSQKSFAQARDRAQSQYLADLQRALDNALTASRVEDARWAKEEMERIRSGSSEPGIRPKSSYNLGVWNRFNRLMERPSEESRRTMEAARRLYITELEAAKKVATTQLRDLDEAERIVAEIKRVKSMQLSTSKSQTIDLLKLLDLKIDSVDGTWKLNDGVLTCDRSVGARIEFPYVPPAEYDFRIVFTRTAGNDGVHQTCAAFGHQFQWGLGVSQNSKAGFFKADNQGFDNQTMKPHSIQNGRKYTSEVKIRDGVVDAFLDGERIAHWKTDYSDMSLFPDQLLHRADTIGICVWDSQVIVESAQVVEISGTGKMLR